MPTHRLLGDALLCGHAGGLARCRGLRLVCLRLLEGEEVAKAAQAAVIGNSRLAAGGLPPICMCHVLRTASGS